MTTDPTTGLAGFRRRLGRVWKEVRRSAAAIGTFLALIALVVSLVQYNATQRQAIQASREATWNHIVSSLASESPAVEVNALLRMVDYVQDGSNFSDRSRQISTAHEVYATLSEYISSNTPNTNQGLQPYDSQTRLTKVTLRAAAQIADLERDKRLGPWTVDLAHTDLHGFSQSHLVLNAPVDMAGIDLREAVLPGISIGPKTKVDLSDSFLTCADLYGTRNHEASLGDANLAGADLQGANLKFVDLSHVRHLKLAQVAHTRWNRQTIWPARFNGKTPGDDAWEDHPGRCTEIINDMTDMLPGEGYADVQPWSTADLPASRQAALAEVRTARSLPTAT